MNSLMILVYNVSFSYFIYDSFMIQNQYVTGKSYMNLCTTVSHLAMSYIFHIWFLTNKLVTSHTERKDTERLSLLSVTYLLCHIWVHTISYYFSYSVMSYIWFIIDDSSAIRMKWLWKIEFIYEVIGVLFWLIYYGNMPHSVQLVNVRYILLFYNIYDHIPLHSYQQIWNNENIIIIELLFTGCEPYAIARNFS